MVSWFRDWWPILSTLALGALAWAMLYLRSQFVTKADHDRAIETLKKENADERADLAALRERIGRDESKIDQQPNADQFNRLVTKVERIEMVLQFLPDKDAVHRLEVSVAALHGELKEVAAQMKPVGAIADRLQEFLLDQAKHR